MNESDLKNALSPLISAGNELQELIQQPAAFASALQDISSNALSPFSSIKDILPRTLPSIMSVPYLFDGCLAGIKAFKYKLDLCSFKAAECLPIIQSSLSTLARNISSVLPEIGTKISLTELNALECETIKTIKSTSNSLDLELTSLRLADSVNALTSLRTAILPLVDHTLGSSSFLQEYVSLIRSQHQQIQKGAENIKAHLGIIELATDLVQKQISSLVQYAEANTSELADVDEDNLVNATKSAIKYIPVYLGYTLRNGSQYELETEFAKSMVARILESGSQLIENIEYINEVSMISGKEAVFKTTTKGYQAVHCVSTAFAVDSATFGYVVDSLYYLLYEGSGNATRLLEIINDEECIALWNIKHLRTDFRHDIEHGSGKNIQKKRKMIADAYCSICGLVRPRKQKDWVEAHWKLLSQTNDMLQTVIDRLQSSS